MKVSIIGTGYVGLVSGVCLAELGHTVTCVDIDNAKVEKINKGIPPIYESGLEDLLRKNIRNKHFAATTDIKNAILESDISIIAVGTPFNGKTIDLGQIKKCSEDMGAALKDKDAYHVVVVKSTVVPGTTDGVVLPIIENRSRKKAGVDFGVGMNPEFLREGCAIEDFMKPDRIVLGGIDKRTTEKMLELYEVFKGVDTVITNNTTAEMIKYTSNSLLATLISFSNEIANICASTPGVDVMDVMAAVHLDKRINPVLSNGSRANPGIISYLNAGCGFGGSCFPKDVKALISYAETMTVMPRVLKAVMEVNQDQPRKLICLLSKHYPSFKNLEVAVLGMAFKPGTDDMRESPAIPVVKTLLEGGAKVRAYDPVAKNEAMKIFGNANINYPETLSDALSDADAVILVTRWEEFNKLGKLVKNLKKQPLIIDGRRMLDKNDYDHYEGVGLNQGK